jgi:hypothetical protein
MGHPALEQFPRLFGEAGAGGSKQMGCPQNEHTSARRLRAKSIVAGGADGPPLENREKWRTPVPSGQQIGKSPTQRTPRCVGHLPVDSKPLIPG